MKNIINAVTLGLNAILTSYNIPVSELRVDVNHIPVAFAANANAIKRYNVGDVLIASIKSSFYNQACFDEMRNFLHSTATNHSYQLRIVEMDSCFYFCLCAY